MKKALLILDLDETLILGREAPSERQADFMCGPYFIYKRPYVHEFVEAVQSHFDVSVWSSATEDYVGCIVKELFPDKYPFRFVWCRDRCTHRVNPRTGEAFFMKDLKKVHRLGYDLKRVLMIDDDVRALSRNYGNLIRVSPYCGDALDAELNALLSYLQSLSDVGDVRSIEKRAWRQRRC